MPIQRQVLSKAEAKEYKTQHTSPCSDCPFRRSSMSGWLGGYQPWQYIQMAQSDVPIECHTRRRAKELGRLRILWSWLSYWQCAGLAIFRTNIFKMTRDEKVLRLRGSKTVVFADCNEFLAHHGGKYE